MVFLVRFSKFSLQNDNDFYFLPVGGYMWGECMVHMARDEKRYSGILNRIIGQVWDSAADITEIPVGVPKALFPSNQTLQSALKHYMM